MRAEAEGARAEAFVRETESAERAQEEEAWAHKHAVILAKSIRQSPRPQFVVETYAPPEPHLFMPSRVDSYVPR